MTIEKICRREVDLADATEPVAEAAKRMRERNVGTLVVLDEKRHPIGILTDRDLTVRVLAEGKAFEELTVANVMTAHPRTIAEATPIEDALRTMRSLGVRRLLVTDERERLAGIVSIDDVLGLIMEELRTMEGILQQSGPAGALART